MCLFQRSRSIGRPPVIHPRTHERRPSLLLNEKESGSICEQQEAYRRFSVFLAFSCTFTSRDLFKSSTTCVDGNLQVFLLEEAFTAASSYIVHKAFHSLLTVK